MSQAAGAAEVAAPIVGSMSEAVDPAQLRRHLAAYGALATVVTVTPAGQPHVGTSLVQLVDGMAQISVGEKSASFVQANPQVCLTWLPLDGSDYQLIVDGVVARAEAGPDGTVTLALELTRIIRHRLAGRTEGPTCVSG